LKVIAFALSKGKWRSLLVQIGPGEPGRAGGVFRTVMNRVRSIGHRAESVCKRAAAHPLSGFSALSACRHSQLCSSITEIADAATMTCGSNQVCDDCSTAPARQAATFKSIGEDATGCNPPRLNSALIVGSSQVHRDKYSQVQEISRRFRSGGGTRWTEAKEEAATDTD
jgi:hypothetical protein